MPTWTRIAVPWKLQGANIRSRPIRDGNYKNRLIGLPNGAPPLRLRRWTRRAEIDLWPHRLPLTHTLPHAFPRSSHPPAKQHCNYRIGAIGAAVADGQGKAEQAGPGGSAKRQPRALVTVREQAVPLVPVDPLQSLREPPHATNG